MIIEVRSLYCEKCSANRLSRFYFALSITLYLFHLTALYFNVISANINQCSQNTHYEAMKKLGVVLNFGWGL